MSSRRNPIIEGLSDPSKNFFAFFLVGVLLFALIADGLSQLFWETFGGWLQRQLPGLEASQVRLLIVVVLVAILLAIIYITPLARVVLGRLTGILWPNPLQSNVIPLTRTFPGLIAIASPSNPNAPNRDSAASRAIKYHWQQGQGQLKHCWLICTDRSLPAVQDLLAELAHSSLLESVEIHYGSGYPIPNPENPQSPSSLLVPSSSVNDVAYLKNLVDGIYLDAERLGLMEMDVIADFTGGLKSMSAGMTLACASPQRHLQYISQLDDDFKEVKFAYEVVKKR